MHGNPPVYIILLLVLVSLTTLARSHRIRGALMTILWALAGLLAGSLLNLAIHRLLRMEKECEPVETFEPPAPNPFYCQSALLYLLVGKLARRARGKARPWWIALGVELSTAVAFALLSMHFGPDPRLLLASLYTCVLVVIFVVDWRRHLIYRVVVYPSILLSLVLTPLVFHVPLYSGLLGLVVGGGVFAAVYGLGLLVFRKEAMGWGDVELAMLLGAMMGFPAIMMVLLATSIFGGIASVALILTRRAMQSYMPYGTAMCLGAFATFFLSIPSL